MAGECDRALLGREINDIMGNLETLEHERRAGSSRVSAGRRTRGVRISLRHPRQVTARVTEVQAQRRPVEDLSSRWPGPSSGPAAAVTVPSHRLIVSVQRRASEPALCPPYPLSGPYSCVCAPCVQCPKYPLTPLGTRAPAVPSDVLSRPARGPSAASASRTLSTVHQPRTPPQPRKKAPASAHPSRLPYPPGAECLRPRHSQNNSVRTLAACPVRA